MSESQNDILLTTPDRKILVWRRVGGGTPGYGLDVDGKTVAFHVRAWRPLQQQATMLAQARGQKLDTPQTERFILPASTAPADTDFERDQMLGRFYTDEITNVWDEPMLPSTPVRRSANRSMAK